jgi:hypothetical protein
VEGKVEEEFKVFAEGRKAGLKIAVEGIISRGSGEDTVLEELFGIGTGNGKMGGGNEKSQSSSQSAKALSLKELLEEGGGGVESGREDRVVEGRIVE